jgi:hypothetical protein
VPVSREGQEREKGQGPNAKAPSPRPPSVGGIRHAPAVEAWEQLATPLTNRKGIRVLFFGITQWGKSTGVRDFLAYVRDQQLVDLTLIHDIKERLPQYDGEIINEADDVPKRPPERYPATRVLRKRDVDHIPSVEAAAKLAFESAYDRTTSMLVIDEFRWALTEGGDKITAEHVTRIFSEGAGIGASIVATKQIPQNTATVAMAQSRLVFFRCATKVVNFLARQGYIDQADGQVIENLELGQFVVIDPEDNFNMTIYQVPAPKRAPPPTEEERAA